MSTSHSASKICYGSKLSPANFSVRIVAALRHAAPSLTVAVRAPLMLDVGSPSGIHWTEDLTRAHDIYAAESMLLDDLVRLRVASMLDMATLADVQPSADLLLPALRRRDEIAGSDIMFIDYVGPPEQLLPTGRPGSSRKMRLSALVITWMIDHPHMPQSVTLTMLDRLGIDDPAHESVALKNLNRRLDEIGIEPLADGVTLVTSDTLPASSLLLLPSFWTGEHFGRLQLVSAIAPDRSMLLVFDGADASARHAAIAFAHALSERAEHPLSVDVITPTRR